MLTAGASEDGEEVELDGSELVDSASVVSSTGCDVETDEGSLCDWVVDETSSVDGRSVDTGVGFSSMVGTLVAGDSVSGASVNVGVDPVMSNGFSVVVDVESEGISVVGSSGARVVGDSVGTSVWMTPGVD